MTLNFPTQPAVTWDEPIEMMYACHGKVRKFCQQLTLLPDYLQKNGNNAIVKQSVKQICEYFNVAAPLHHADEEQDFFPALRQLAPQSASTIDELARQHHIMANHWAHLLTQLNELLNDTRAELPQKNAVDDFVGAYARHMALEEPLFELGKRLIPSEQQKTMGIVMAKRRQ